MQLASGPPRADMDMTKHTRVRELYHAAGKGQNLRALFSEVDTDSSLDLTLEEFDHFVEGVVDRAAEAGGDEAAASGIAAEEIEATFNFIDNDNSGTINRDEFEQYMGMYHEEGVNLLDV